MPLVILEGPRGSGKTTIAKELADYLIAGGIEAKVWKFQRGPNPFGEMESYLANNFDSNTIHIIDRWHLTELVMSTYHNRVELDELRANTSAMDLKLMAMAVTGVVLAVSPNIQAVRVAERNDGRGLEMPIGVSRLLWHDACELSYFRCIDNNSSSDRESLLNYLFARSIIAMNIENQKKRLFRT